MRSKDRQPVSSEISWGIAVAGSGHKVASGRAGGTRICSVLGILHAPPAIESELVDP